MRLVFPLTHRDIINVDALAPLGASRLSQQNKVNNKR